MNIKPGSVWIFTRPGNPRNGHEYIVEHTGKMKFDDGAWWNAVTYRDTVTATLYTRDTDTFLKKFVPRRAEVQGTNGTSEMENAKICMGMIKDFNERNK